MAFSYRQVKDLYDILHKSGAASSSLPEWSQQMNADTESELYGAGLNDNFIKRSSVAMDRALEGIPGLVEGSRKLGAGFGGLFGQEEVGARIGEGLPRMTANFLPVIAGSLATGPAAPFTAAAGLAATGALSGAQTYTETGSPAAGLLSGVTAAALPGITGKIERGILAKLGAEEVAGPLAGAWQKQALGQGIQGPLERLPIQVGQTSQRFGNFLQNTVANLGGQVGAAAISEAAGLGQDILAGRPLHDVFSPETALNLTLGQLPFAALHLGSKALKLGKSSSEQADLLRAAINDTQKGIDRQAVLDVERNKTDFEKLPDLTAERLQAKQKVTQDEIDARLANLGIRRQELSANPTEGNIEELQRIQGEEAQTIQDAIAQTGGKGIGLSNKAYPLEGRVPIKGENLFYKPSTGYHVITATEIPEGLTYSDGTPVQIGDRIGFPSSKFAHEEPPQNKDANSAEFFLPSKKAFTKVIDRPETNPPNVPSTTFTTIEGTVYKINPDRSTQKQGPNPVKSDKTVYVTPEQAAVGQFDAGQGRPEKGLVPVEFVNGIPQVGAPIKEIILKYKLPEGQAEAPFKEIPVQKQAFDLEQHMQNMHRLKSIVTSGKTWGEMVEALELLNLTRKNSGYKEIDLEQLKSFANEQGIPTADAALQAVVDQTVRLEQVEAEAKADALKGMKDEVETMASVTADAQMGDEKAKAVLDYYSELGAESGRRGEIAVDKNGNSLYWQWVKELQGQGKLNVTSLRNRVENAVKQGEGIKTGALSKEEIPKQIFGALSSDEAAAIQLGAEAVMRVTAKDSDSLEAKVLREMLAVGIEEKKFNFSKEAVAEAVVDAGLADEGADANLLAEDFLASPKVKGWLGDLKNLMLENERPGLQALGDPFVPEGKLQTIVADNLTGNGVKVLESILIPGLIYSEPSIRAIAKDFIEKFPEALANIKNQVEEIRGTANNYINSGDLGSTNTYGPGVVRTNAESRAQTILHEHAHGLTSQLTKSLPPDHPLIKSLDDILKRAVDALPPELRKNYDRAIENNFYMTYSAMPNLFGELAPDYAQRNVLYGLLNRDELIAQTYSSKPFREYLKSVKGKTGESLWKTFVNWSKRLFGFGDGISDTLLGEVIEASGQLMEKGEFLSGVQNFGERYFEGKGKGGAYGKAQTQRALGLIHGSEGGITVEQLIRALGEFPTDRNLGLKETRAKLEQDFAQGGEDSQHLGTILSEEGHDPSVRGLDDFVETALAEGRDIQDAMDLLTPKAASYVFEKLKDHKDVLDMLKAATGKKQAGLLNIQEPGILREPVAKALKGIERLLGQQDRQVKFAQDLVGLNAVEPEGFVGQTRNAPQFVNDFVAGAKEAVDGTGSWVANFLEPMGQLARRIPAAAEAISKGFQLVPNARVDSSSRLKVFGLDIAAGKLGINPTRESVKESSKVASTPRLLDAFHKWVYWNQQEGGDSVQMLPESHPEVAKVLNGLSTEDKIAVRDMVLKQGLSTQVGHANNLESMAKVAATDGAGILLTEFPMKIQEAMGAATSMLQAIQKIKDPLTQWQGQAELQAIQGKLPPEAFLTLLKFSQGEAEKIGLWKGYYDKNPFWATAQRMERYLVKGKAGNTSKTLQASSVKEARALAEKAGLTKLEIVDQWKGKEDEPFQYPNMTPEMAERMKQIEDNQIEMLERAGLLDTPESIDAFQQTSAVSQILREAAANGLSTAGLDLPARRLSKGAEDLPWLWNHISHAQKESTYWSRQLLRAQTRTFLKDPELANIPEVRTRLKTHFENLLEPDPAIAQKMTKFASVWFMGFNLASSLVNATQPFVTHVSELTAMTGKPIESYRRISRALKEAGGIHLSEAGEKLGGTRKEWANPEHARLMQDAAGDGERTLSMYDDNAQAQESIDTNHKRAMMKNKPQSLGQRLSTAAGAYSTAAMWVFKHGERLNSDAALLASFDLAREQGLGYEQAKAKAYEFNHAVNFSGGRAQRPVGAFSGRGAFPRTAAMLGTSLQSYVLGTTAQIGRYLQKGLFRPEGIKPHEVFAARKAALQMLGTQFAAAGLLGLPFASGAIALLNQLFPDLELNRKLRQGMSDFLSSDKENGSTLTDIAMTGVPSMLGWDLQSRLSMGNMLPGVSEVNGFQPENLMGPASNIVKNFVGGVQGWAKGDAKAGMKFIPNGARSLIQAGANLLSGEDGIRDYQGRPLAFPTMGEKLGLGLGFQPKRLSDQNAASRIAGQAQEVMSRQMAAENQDMAKEVLKGNFGNVRQRLIEKAQTDKNYNPQDAVRAIARTSEEMTFPRDLRREGQQNTSNLRSSFLNSFSNLGVQGPSEVDRWNFRQQIEAKLGLPPTRSGSELEVAKLMDRMKLERPTATRMELKVAAQQLLRRQIVGQHTLSLPQE